MNHSYFQLRRLRVIHSGKPVYDQDFHAGVNIIRGDNGSGKSTVADFIFYILGGEFDNWKTVAGSCDQVQAEVVTRGGIISLRRDVEKAQTPMQVFFGPMAEAEQHGLDGWQLYPIRRSENKESFSQVFFRSCGIPEAQSQGASNITMNQLLRLLYSDQRTPSAFLFKYENFDTREIREAVGDLICGLSAYELYETELQLRKLQGEFDEKNQLFAALLQAMPKEQTLLRPETIDYRLKELTLEAARMADEISNVAKFVEEKQVQNFVRERSKAVDGLQKIRTRISAAEQELRVNELEQADLHGFLDYLKDLLKKMPRAEASSEIVGNIDFTYCPACLTELSPQKGADHCVVCGSATDPEQARSRYLQIRMDLEIQIRESEQLSEDRNKQQLQIERQLRTLQRDYQDLLSEYTVKYDVSTSPRDSFVAERYRRIGQIDSERIELARLRERALEISLLSEEKAKLQEQISLLKDKQAAFEAASKQRRAIALTAISEKARDIIRQDLPGRQDEFQSARSVQINFGDNSVMVDGELNFAESSNVIVKNAAILALILAASKDPQFYHPRFALFDNIEDKGMQQERSHNFQAIIVQESQTAPLEHQIIVTTSMINPQLDQKEIVIGPYYSKATKRTLSVSSADTAATYVPSGLNV
jgi:hypothetical protein